MNRPVDQLREYIHETLNELKWRSFDSESRAKRLPWKLFAKAFLPKGADASGSVMTMDRFDDRDSDEVPRQRSYSHRDTSNDASSGRPVDFSEKLSKLLDRSRVKITPEKRKEIVADGTKAYREYRDEYEDDVVAAMKALQDLQKKHGF
jgi:hypothetical protein